MGLWDGVKSVLSGILPIAAKVIDPTGGVVTGLIANVLGVDDTPDAIEEGLKNATPAQIIELKKMELQHKETFANIALRREELQVTKEISTLQTVNQTMQAETKSKWWFSAFWRPFWGIVSALAFFVVVVFITILAYKAVIGGKPEAMVMIPQLISAFAALFAIPGAILGVSAWHRGKMQRAEAGETKAWSGGLTAALINKITK